MKYIAEEELLELKGEVKILQGKEELYQKDIRRLKQHVEALETALEEKTSNDIEVEGRPERKKREPLEPLEELTEDDFGTDRPPEVQGLIAEIMLLRKRIKELQPDGDEGSNFREEETKDSRDGKRAGELEEVS